MGNLIKSEWFKLRKSLGFKILLAGTVISTFTILILLAMGSAGTGSQLMAIGFSYVLHHAFVGFLFAAVYWCNESSNRTFALSLLCGHSRRKVFLAKAVVFLFGLLLLFGVYVALTTVYASVSNGFGQEWSVKTGKHMLVLLGCGLSGWIAMGAVMVLVAAVFRKTILTFGAGMALTYALLWLETNFRNHPLPFVKYTYSYQMNQLWVSWEEGTLPGTFLAVTLSTAVAALAAAAFAFQRAELK